MATESIFTNIVLSDPKEVQMLIDALEASEKDLKKETKPSIAPLRNLFGKSELTYMNHSKEWFFCVYKSSIQKERMVKILKQFNIYKSTMKYLTDRNLSLNAKGFLTIVLFNDEIIGLDIQKYCTDNKETIRDALLELRINKYIKYDSESKRLIAAPVPYNEWDEDLR